MARPKVKYAVYARRSVKIECEPSVDHPWEFIAETTAVSEKEAINNVRFNKFGATTSQYLPTEVGGHYEVWIEWKAEPQ